MSQPLATVHQTRFYAQDTDQMVSTNHKAPTAEGLADVDRSLDPIAERDAVLYPKDNTRHFETQARAGGQECKVNHLRTSERTNEYSLPQPTEKYHDSQKKSRVGQEPRGKGDCRKMECLEEVKNR